MQGDGGHAHNDARGDEQEEAGDPDGDRDQAALDAGVELAAVLDLGLNELVLFHGVFLLRQPLQTACS